jgi:hypothetical protein
MSTPDFDKLLAAYKQATDAWVSAIRAEESLANADHSEVEMEKWDAADFAVQNAEAAAKAARDAYQDALREKNFNF